MDANDKIKVSWTRIDTTAYSATMTVAEYAERIGMSVEELLTYARPSEARDDGTLDLADELANVEDAGDAQEVSSDCQREDIRIRVKKD